MANRWSGRAAYTLSKARDVGTGVRGEARVVNDLDPRTDYGLSDFDNRHAFTAGGNWDAWRGLSAGATFRFYSGNPVNETIGLDANGDRDNTDRPVKGINDLTKPILSAGGRQWRRHPERYSRLAQDAPRPAAPVRRQDAEPANRGILLGDSTTP